MKDTIVSEAYAGPPLVKGQIMANELNTHMILSKLAIIIDGRIKGKVIFWNCINEEAPSMAAHSYSSFSIPCMPASNIIVVNGKEAQMETTIIAGKDVLAEASH
jgi:hypothetical protein